MSVSGVEQAKADEIVGVEDIALENFVLGGGEKREGEGEGGRSEVRRRRK